MGWMHATLASVIAFLMIVVAVPHDATAWSNGGKSPDLDHPKYGTHDWIAQRALDLLPQSERYFISDNLNAYLYGTEIPDFIYSDTFDHHVYFYANGTVMEDNAAKKARDHFKALKDSLKAKDTKKAAEEAGIMTHYLDDVAVFAHVLSSKTVWGAEKHHSDFEDDALEQTNDQSKSFFTVTSDGLASKDAYNATIEMAKATTFGDNGAYNARWLDDNYVNNASKWPAEYKIRINSLISYSANQIADVIHAAVIDSGAVSPGGNDPNTFRFPNLTQTDLIIIGLIIGALLIIGVSLARRHR